MKLTAVMLAFGLCGCTLSSISAIPLPRAGERAAPNMDSIQTAGSELLGYAPDDLVARVSLIRMDREATCFDVVFRSPVGRPLAAPPMKFTIEVDRLEAAGFEAHLPECRPEHSCLPPDSPLRVYAEEPRPKVISYGARLCVTGLAPAEHEIALLEVEPVGTAAFRFRFRAPVEGESPTR
jgi:hypothetical protein